MPIVLVKIVLWKESEFLTCSHYSDMHNAGDSHSTNQYEYVEISSHHFFSLLFHDDSDIELYNFQRSDQATTTALASERTAISTAHPRQCKTSDNGGGGICHHISVLFY